MDVMTRQLAPADAVQTIPVDESVVLVDGKSGQYYGLNEVGAAIWHLVEQGRDANTIVAELLREFEADEVVIVADTRRILGELLDAGLLS